MGWKTKGTLDPKFEEVAFALEPSTTSSPKFVEVKTGFGYHIIMVRRFIVLAEGDTDSISRLRAENKGVHVSST